jgi:hypothetical protein
MTFERHSSSPHSSSVRSPGNDAVRHDVSYGLVAAPVSVLVLNCGNETIHDFQRGNRIKPESYKQALDSTNGRI